MSKAYERLLVLEGAHNVRDLGGYATMTGASTRWRALLRSDGLHLLSAADIESLLRAGLSTVIDLRSAEEIALEINPFGVDGRVQYHNLPLFSALAPILTTAKTGKSPFDMAARYRDAIENCQPAIAGVLCAIATAPEGIVLFHCSAGKDRTGIIAAILLAIAGVDDNTITEDYALTGAIAGRLIERLREKSLRGGADPAFIELVLASEPQTMRSTLQHITRIYGSMPDYVVRIGLSNDEIEKLRQRILG
ncbi:tyrosine-protein phosphatase [Rhizobium mayense]|uniref:Tyrosine-protein phosphatase n=1 Tax=Rhizobium mayense TaxID=1312184 RepID=A0ABT7JQV7_9HYPH|nr:tyrosine-protein phosphatase [Rhizobium mayense]MDL2398297.1 tyrosine-protein phosphatase [Rhizobium mayense]